MIHLTSLNISNIELNKIYSTPNDISYYWKHKLEGGWENIDEFIHIKDNINKLYPGVNEILSPIYDIMTPLKYSSELFKEYVFEEVRQEINPSLPSRKNCIFCLPDNCDIATMRIKYKLTDKLRPVVLKIKEIEGESNMITCDANLLNCNIRKVNEIKAYAIQYWSGQLSDNPLIEILLNGKYKISEVMS